MTERAGVEARRQSGKTAPDLRIARLASPVRLALRAMTELARTPARFVETSALAARLGLPAASLAKTFQSLARGGLLDARRGPGGGYRLARAAARLTLSQIVAALADAQRVPLCLMEDRPCSPSSPCALHQAADAADALLRRRLDTLTLEDLCAR